MRNSFSIAAILGAALGAVGCGASEGIPAGDAGAKDGAYRVFIDASVILVGGGQYACPGISAFSIDPAEVAIGQPAQLGIETIGPAPSTIEWTVSPASGGTLSDASAAQPTFQCRDAGRVTVAAGVTLVVPGAGNVCQGVRYTTYSGAVVCE